MVKENNCINLIDSIARNILNIFQDQDGVKEIPVKDYGWENYKYASSKFRTAHVQIFRQPKFIVLHSCVYPHKNDDSPIFGFDAIAGENKITGVFFDLSPTVKNGSYQFTNLEIEKSRDRPSWGDIFSDYWLACRPTFEEMEIIGIEVDKVLTTYLTTLGPKQNINEQEIINGQNYYCEQQKKNPHTRKSLENILGVDGAEEYMSTILFPKFQ